MHWFDYLKQRDIWEVFFRNENAQRWGKWHEWGLSCRWEVWWLNASADVLKKLGCLRILPLGANCQLTHQHIPEGWWRETFSIPFRLRVVPLEMPCTSSSLAPNHAAKQAVRKPAVLDAAFDGETGVTQLKITLERHSLTTIKGRSYDSVLCTFTYFMGTQNEIFTN